MRAREVSRFFISRHLRHALGHLRLSGVKKQINARATAGFLLQPIVKRVEEALSASNLLNIAERRTNYRVR